MTQIVIGKPIIKKNKIISHTCIKCNEEVEDSNWGNMCFKCKKELQVLKKCK